MSDKQVTQTIFEVEINDDFPESRVSQVMVQADIEDTAPSLQVCDLLLEVSAIQYEGMYLGEISVPHPVSIEQGVGGSLSEFDLVENVRDITAHPGYFYTYRMKWVILDKNQSILMEFSRHQDMPTRIFDTYGLMDFSGFILDYKSKIIQDIPPQYEIEMLIESDRLI